MFLLDNCPIHKTALAVDILNRLNIPTIFSAPASYKAIPVEELFGAIKLKDFNKIRDLMPAEVGQPHFKKLTNKQAMMVKVSDYLFSLEPRKVTKIFG